VITKTIERVTRELDALFHPVSPAPAPIEPSRPAEKPQAPEILDGPEDRTTTVCHASTFTVRVRGTAPITAQWRQNGSNIKFGSYTKGVEGEGLIEFDFDYSHMPLDLQDEGAIFDVVVSNAVGCVTSKSATLTVKEAPEKTLQEQAAAFHQIPITKMKRIKTK
jgi:hypothetical protein